MSEKRKIDVNTKPGFISAISTWLTNEEELEKSQEKPIQQVLKEGFDKIDSSLSGMGFLLLMMLLLRGCEIIYH